MPGSDDDRLIERVAAGDRAAWAALFERHLAAVVGFAWYQLGDRAAAEDVAQETFVRLIGKIEGWQPGGPALRTWLFRVARNLCIDHRRAARMVPLEALPDRPGDAPDLERSVDLRRSVRRALDSLPERQRTALVLVTYLGLTNQEAAGTLDVSEEAVESLLARARRTLRQRLEAAKSELLGAD